MLVSRKPVLSGVCRPGFTEKPPSAGFGSRVGHPFSLVNALSFSSFIHAMRRQGEETLRLANEYQRVATKHGFAQMAAWSLIHRGNGLIVLNQAEQGILEILKGIAASRATGSKASMPYALAILDDGYRRAGDVTAGLEAIAEGLAVSEASGERLFDAELYRLRGELLLHSGANAEANREEPFVCFRKALAISISQQAKWWALRASMSLARLLSDTGRRDETRAMLADVYGWFTEGFDTADLKEAKVLLDEPKE
jgi:predicted ATPase